MNRFWSRHVGPLIRAIAPARLCAIGAGDALAIQHLLDHARQTGGHVDIVEPRPTAPLYAALAAHGDTSHSLHVASGAAALPAPAAPDVMLIDGDPNWHAVSADLAQLRAPGGAAAMPVVLVHGSGWPHGRRDGYVDPAGLDETRRKPHAYLGMLPGVAELVEDGVGGDIANALAEGGPANGVLTAIEDFVAAHHDIHLWTLPFWGGLAILVPHARLTPGLAVTIEGFYAGEGLLDTCRALDADLARARAETLVERRLLERRSDALVRARRLLAERADRIAALEIELAAALATSRG